MRITLLRYFAISGVFFIAVFGTAKAQDRPAAPALWLKTSAFTDGGNIPMKYSSCNLAPGAPMISPSFEWSNVPNGTASFVLIMHDIDFNPMKSILDVTHWTVYNIPGSATELPEGVTPGTNVLETGQQGKNIRGMNGYLGPCPPPGNRPHHYVFEFYALDQKLDLPAGASRADLLKAMDGHVLGKSSYVGMFPAK